MQSICTALRNFSCCMNQDSSDDERMDSDQAELVGDDDEIIECNVESCIPLDEKKTEGPFLQCFKFLQITKKNQKKRMGQRLETFEEAKSRIRSRHAAVQYWKPGDKPQPHIRIFQLAYSDSFLESAKSPFLVSRPPSFLFGYSSETCDNKPSSARMAVYEGTKMNRVRNIIEIKKERQITLPAPPIALYSSQGPRGKVKKARTRNNAVRSNPPPASAPIRIPYPPPFFPGGHFYPMWYTPVVVPIQNTNVNITQNTIGFNTF